MRDLKLKLVEKFNAMPVDQHLQLAGTELQDGELLACTGVKPGDTLTLIIDEAWPSVPEISTGEPEVGFRGTTLVGGKANPVVIDVAESPQPITIPSVDKNVILISDDDEGNSLIPPHTH